VQARGVFSTTGCTKYEIVVRGHLGPRLAQLLDGFEIAGTEHGRTRLVGWTPDQAALHGALREIGAFGLELVALRALDDD
jgi:hypothetical protein